MNFRFVTKRIHAFLDYPVALVLIAAPFLLHLGDSAPMAKWLSVATGVAALVLTVFTDHHLGIVRVLPYKLHLKVDSLVALVFLAAPVLFGFAGLDRTYYWANGAALLIVVSLHQPEQPVAIAATA